jgi:autotransporter-associated beta strand protein
MKTNLSTRIVLAAWLTLLVCTTAPALAVTNYWKGTGTDWGTTANWYNQTNTSADVAAFTNATYANQPSLGADVSLGMLWQKGAGAVTLNAGSLRALTWHGIDIGGTVYGIRMDSGSGALTLSANVSNVLQNSQTWLNNSANALTVQGRVNNNGNTLTLDGTGNFHFAATTGNSVISGTGGITMNGSGFVTMGAAATVPIHTYTGTTTINGGVMMFAGNLPAASHLSLTGGVYEAYWTETFIRSLGTGAGQVQVVGGASGFSENGNSGMTIKLNNSTATVIWGALGEGAATGFFNPTTLVLQSQYAQANSTLDFQNGIDLNGTTRTIAVNKTSVGTGYAQISGVITNSSGTAGLVKTGPGVLNLTAANKYNGITTVSNGVLRLSNANALPGGIGVTGGSNNLVLAGGVVELANANFLRNLGAGAAEAQITGGTSGFSAFGGARVVTINNNASQVVQWGSTYFNPDTFVLNASSANNTLTFQNILDLNGANRTIGAYANTATISGNITNTTGTAGLIKTGGGILTLSGNNSYDGSTTISGGTLSVGASTNLGAGSIVFNGGVLQITGTTFINLGRTVTNASGQSAIFDINNAANTFALDQAMTLTAGRLDKYGTGTLVLTGATFSTSRALVNAGSLRVLGGAGIPTVWNLGGGTAVVMKTSTSLTIDGGGVDGGAVLTNARSLLAPVDFNEKNYNNVNIVVTNGARVFLNGGTTLLGATEQNNSVFGTNTMTIVGGPGVTTVVNAGGGAFWIGGVANTGAQNNKNRLVIAAGGILTNMGTVFIGLPTGPNNGGAGGNYNQVIVSGGGKVFSTGAVNIGNITANGQSSSQSFSNMVTVTGANSVWNLGGANLIVGNGGSTVGANSNALAVSDGGLMTNINSLVVGPGPSRHNSVALSGGSLFVNNLVASNTGNRVIFNAGTLSVANSTVYSNGTDFVVGNGTDAATLLLNGGTHRFQAAVQVANNGKLGGTGTVAAPVNVLDGGTLAPGNSAGIFTVGTLTLASNSTFAVELGGTAAGSYDRVVVNGSATLTDSILSVTLINGFVPNLDDTFLILTNSGSTFGTFAGLGEGAQFTAGGYIFEITYSAGDGNDVQLTVIPEPGSLVLVGAGLAFFLVLRRRK